MQNKDNHRNSIEKWQRIASRVEEHNEIVQQTIAKKSGIIPTRSNILNAISNDESFVMFKTIALGDDDSDSSSSDIVISKTNLTRKQFYSRMSEMLKAGLLKRKNRKYSLTSLGKIIYHNQQIIQKALANYWKLKAIDSIETFDVHSKEERQRLIESLIDDNDIQEILTKKYSFPVMKKDNVLIQKFQGTSSYKQQEKPYLNIMLVEDEQDTLLTYKAFLAAEGYNVDAFADSYEAFKHFINLNAPYYDLVITDIRMPKLNGLQLYQRIKSIDNTINVIFVSGLDFVQELVSIFPNLNLNNIIRKPVTKEEFLNKVKAAIDQSTTTITTITTIT